MRLQPMDELARRVKKPGMPAVAITHLGSLFGALEFLERALDLIVGERETVTRLLRTG